MSLPDELESLLLEIQRSENALLESECIAIMSQFLTQRCEWRTIVRAERRRDVQTLERYATSAVNENIRQKAREFIQNVKSETLHTSRGGVIHNPVPEAANARD